MASCIDLLIKILPEVIKNANYELTELMTNPDKSFEDTKIIPQLSYETYYKTIKKEWETILNSFIDSPNKCSNNLQSLFSIYEMASKIKLDLSLSTIQNILTGKENITEDIKNQVLNAGIDAIKQKTEHKFEFTENFFETFKSFGMILYENCQCQMIEIFTFFLNKYKTKYFEKYKNEDSSVLLSKLQNLFETVKNYKDFFVKKTDTQDGDSLLRNELDKLIPNELGTMKDFFIKIIEKYFINLHPIVWCQIYTAIMENLFKDLPLTPDEIFAFLSKQILLNTGPFILKLLQMIVPYLPTEVKNKYNIEKLFYPLMSIEEEVIPILNKILKLKKKRYYELDEKIKLTYDTRYKIIAHFSASVGHVVLLYCTKYKVFIIVKMIKPKSIAQNSWEEHILKAVFDPKSCNGIFVSNMLEAIRKEMNVTGEIENINKGYEYYSATYLQVFGVDANNARLTTVQNVTGIIKEGVWFALAMTKAEGKSVAYLIENNLIENDLYLKNNLYRCFDILVYKFFDVLINKGFFHGDLHAGNMFYDVDTNKLTLIDFGAVGYLNLLEGDKTSIDLFRIILKASYYNYDELLDLLANILNERCVSDNNSIDMSSDKYKEFKKELIKYKFINLLNYKKELKKNKDIFNELMSKTVLDKEKQKENKDVIVSEVRKIPDIDNDDVLDQPLVSFNYVMIKIGKFFAENNINIGVKFAELNELQKAYTLLEGALNKSGYSSARFGNALSKGIKNSQTYFSGLKHPITAASILVKLIQEEIKLSSCHRKLYELYEEKKLEQ